ncbi:MaoC family dehydratase [Castellaniella sp. GW247-6E4]|uniref:MaoC family dehydratase n=1 Tax=Castellaniella sp. GW247-6E4 TaxID=3140380 RepID=UPI003314E181
MIENKYYEDYEVGELVVSDTFAISTEDVAAYCKLVGDDHKIHLDKEFCKQQLGVDEVVVPGCLTLAMADSRWAALVTPSDPYSPHYGQDKVRYPNRLLANEPIFCEFKLIDKRKHNDVYGMLTFETYVRNLNGDAILFEIDKVLVPFRVQEQ